MGPPKIRRGNAEHSAATTPWLLVLSLLGAILLMSSIMIDTRASEMISREVLRDFLKELGIVVLAVCSVSLIYEATLAKRYRSEFLQDLSEQIERGESIAGVCADIGIEKIYARRDKYQADYPLRSFEPFLDADSCLRIIGRALVTAVNKVDSMQKALLAGAALEFCLFDPRGDANKTSKNPDVIPADIQLTVAVFTTQLLTWIEQEKPPGTLTLKLHRNPMLDSFFLITSKEYQFCAWDWSFGRDLPAKKIVIVNPKKELGENLRWRYDFVWNGAEEVFVYRDKAVAKNDLSQLAKV
jgi:hypothetical protein